MKKANTPTIASAEPKVELTAAELAEMLILIAERSGPIMFEAQLVKAEAEVKRVKIAIDRAGHKQLRILQARSVEEATQIQNESAWDANLKWLCSKLPGWRPLLEAGATDDQLLAFLRRRGKGWPDSRATTSMPAAETNHGQMAAVWVDPDQSEFGPAHLSGKKLADAVRRVMGIKTPAPAPKPPTPKKTVKKAAPKKKPTPKAAKPAVPPADDEGSEASEQPAPITRGTRLADAATMRLLESLYSADKLPKLRGIYTNLAGEEWVCTAIMHGHGKVPESVKLWRVVPRKGYQGKVSTDVHGNYPGMLVSHRGRQYVITFPCVDVEFDGIMNAADQLSKSPQNDATVVTPVEASNEAPLLPPKIPGKRSQTFGQWASVLRRLPDGVEIDPNLPTRAGELTPVEQAMLDYFVAGKRPGEARDAWIAAQASTVEGGAGKDAGAAMPEASDDEEQYSQMEAGVRYDADEVGLDGPTLEAALKAVAILPTPPDWTAPKDPTIGVPVSTPDGLYAVIRASHKAGAIEYLLVPAYTSIEWWLESKTPSLANFEACSKREGRPCAPEDVNLDGLQVFDVEGAQWVIGSNRSQGVWCRLESSKSGEAVEAPAANVTETFKVGDRVLHVSDIGTVDATDVGGPEHSAHVVWDDESLDPSWAPMTWLTSADSPEPATPERPEGQGSTWHQWRPNVEAVVRRRAAAEEIELPENFEVTPDGDWIICYAACLKPAETAEKFIESIRSKGPDEEANRSADADQAGRFVGIDIKATGAGGAFAQMMVVDKGDLWQCGSRFGAGEYVFGTELPEATAGMESRSEAIRGAAWKLLASINATAVRKSEKEAAPLEQLASAVRRWIETSLDCAQASAKAAKNAKAPNPQEAVA